MVSGTSATSNSTDTSVIQSSMSSGEMDKDAFLNLLITQMRFQDPMKPLDDREFIAQLAQFSSLEQMQQVNGSLALLAQMNAASQAASLIGKTVTVAGEDDSTITGVVDAVKLEEGQIKLVMGENEFSPAEVIRIE